MYTGLNPSNYDVKTDEKDRFFVSFAQFLTAILRVLPK